MKKYILGIILTLSLLILFTGAIDASRASLAIYLLMFLLVFILFGLIISLIIRVGYGSMHKTSRAFISFVLAIIPIGIIALSTLSSVTIMDFALVLAIPILLLWYGFKNNLIK